MSNNEYVRLSLELHLFFDRILKEHSFFLAAAFLDKNNDLREIANNFQKTFAGFLEKDIYLADKNLSLEFLQAGEIVTKDTIKAEALTNDLTGAKLDSNLTIKELNLENGILNVNDDIIRNISILNRQTLPVVKNLVEFKNDILNRVLSCKLYTANYPLLITHIMNEAKMYYNLLSKIEKKEAFTTKYLYEQELFWNTIMMEHAEFIRGLLDPSEKELIKASNEHAKDYEEILKNYSSNPLYLTNISLQKTLDFKKFKTAGVEGLLNCKIKSIIVPLLADHILREANHFIRILRQYGKNPRV